MANIIYSPPPSLAGFLVDESFVSLAVGPLGSTKTTAAIMKIAYHAKQMAACTDGIRRSRVVWVRNTREQLRDTSIPDFLKWFPDGIAGSYAKTDYNFLLKFDDVECQVMWRGLDDANDVKRLLSLQLSFGVLDEFREINPQIFDALQGRLGRYPDKMLVPPRPEWGVNHKGEPIGGCVTDDGRPNHRLWGASNPPDMDTFWEEYLSNPPDNCTPYFQPGGLSPDADWTQWLVSDYYETLAQGKTEAWIDIYINAKFGKSLAGRPVFPSFDAAYHVAKGPLKAIQSVERPLIIGFDFGLNPSVTINQLDMQGRLLTLDALTSSGMGVTRFVQTILKPLLATKYPMLPLIVVGDPAGTQRAQTDERSCFDILRAEGFKVISARTNSIVARIAAVDVFLGRQIDGGPGWLIDPGCKVLIHAMRGGYRYKTKRSGEVELQPEKNDASHISDAQQYACLHANGGVHGSLLEQPRRAMVKAPSLGWT